MKGLTQHKTVYSREMHPDVYDRPYYVLANPTMYTREEVAKARQVAWTSPKASEKDTK